MTQAKNYQKMMKHQQSQIHARIIKLTKEEERANKRIKDAERKSEFIAKMNQIKEEKIATKKMWLDEMRDKEEANRYKNNQIRNQNKMMINEKKMKVFTDNRNV